MNTPILHILSILLSITLAIRCAPIENVKPQKPETLIVTPNNPILKVGDPNFLYLADPAAEVYNGRLYVYCSHDQDDAAGYSSMRDYALLSTDDMVNWTNHGVIINPNNISDNYIGQMNAPDAAYKDGKYYLYFPYNKTYIGVAQSDKPEGPWTDASNGTYITAIFDPTVFIDDDGQAYIYGNDLKVPIGEPNTHIYGAKLKDNMTELATPWTRLSEEPVAEAVHLFKREGKYYFTARKGLSTSYWMADNPLPTPENGGYAEYKGEITVIQNDAPAHNSFVEYKGQWYIFYQRGDVNNGNGCRRSACFDKLNFNEDGTIQFVNYTLGDLTFQGDTSMPNYTYYPDENITTYSIDYLYEMTSQGNFPEGTTWYIEDNQIEKVEHTDGDDKLDLIIRAATENGYPNGSITLDFSYSTFRKLDAAFCPSNVNGATTGYLPEFNSLGAITGLNKVSYVLSWTFRNFEYLKKVEGFDDFYGTLGNFSFYDLPALESITMKHVTAFGSRSCFYNCTSLEYINTPNLVTCSDVHFGNAAPKTWYLTTDTDIDSTFALNENFDASGCDLYLSATNYAYVENQNQWKGKTWKSITQVD